MKNTTPNKCKTCTHLFYAFTNKDKIPCCGVSGWEVPKPCFLDNADFDTWLKNQKELYRLMVNQIKNLQEKNGIMTRHEVIAYFIGYFGTIDEEKFDLINKLYLDKIINA